MATGKWRIKIDPKDDRFGAVLVCAVRYCIGRSTVLQDDVCKYIRGLFPVLKTGVLWAMADCIEEHQKKKRGWTTYFDMEMWLKFQEDAKKEMERRRNNV